MKDGILKIIYWTGMIVAFLLPFPMALGIGFNIYYVQMFPLWVAILFGVISFCVLVYLVGKLVGRW